MPVPALMVAVAEAARESTAAAAGALSAAKQLTPAAAWDVYQTLQGWPGADARRLGADLAWALTAEWRRLELPVEDPELAKAKRQRSTGRGLFGTVEAAS